MKRRWFFLAALCSLALLSGGACAQELKGDIKIDGSSTVYLISQKMATAFRQSHPAVNISIGISGTGGGFKKFASGEIDIADASRRIKAEEAAKCKANGIDYIELHVAWDGLAVIVNKQNTWATKMTVDQLKKIWHPNEDGFQNADKWSDVDPSWPKVKIELFGPGADSGTFDYFTEAINGKGGKSRKDFQASEDDQVIVEGVVKSKYALGYLGLAYYEEQKDKLAEVAIKGAGSNDYVLPNATTVLTRKYQPLGRELFLYVKKSSLKRPEVQEFCRFCLRRSDLVSEVGYIRMTAPQQLKARGVLEAALKGL